MAGIVIAVISAIINFVWLPYSPWWVLMVNAKGVRYARNLAAARSQA
jgi:hypothetical protein